MRVSWKASFMHNFANSFICYTTTSFSFLLTLYEWFFSLLSFLLLCIFYSCVLFVSYLTSLVLVSTHCVLQVFNEKQKKHKKKEQEKREKAKFTTDNGNYILQLVTTTLSPAHEHEKRFSNKSRRHIERTDCLLSLFSYSLCIRLHSPHSALASVFVCVFMYKTIKFGD